MRKTYLFLCLLFSVSLFSYSQEEFTVKLWPNGLPNTNGKDHLPENYEKGIYTPEIRVFLPNESKATGRAVLACPGGAYSHLALGHEGYDWAPFYNDLGIAYIVLKYRMPNGNREVPISDALEAMRLIKAHANEWNINPYDIGIMGSSAGGHLASTVATTAPFALRPNFQILFYPVISMQEKKTHKGSMQSLLGPNPSIEEQKKYSNENNVIRHLTPPAIMLLSQDDLVVPPANSMDYFMALTQKFIPTALHVYTSGNHGYGVKSSFAHQEQMMNDLSQWLSNLKAPQKDAIRVACIGNSITDGAGIKFSNVHGYPAILQRLLGDEYHVKNFGVSGHTMLNKGNLPYMKHPAYQAAKDFNPNIVVIKLGTNDSKPQNWVHKNEFAKDLQQMIDELQALPAQPKIYLSYPIPVFKDNWGITDSVIVNEIRPIINKVAKKNKLDIIDFYTPLYGKNEVILSDGIHPNHKGVKLMAEIVKEALKK